MVFVPLDITVYRGRNIVSATSKTAQGSEPPNSYCTINYKKLCWSTLTVPKCTNPVWNTNTTFDDVNIDDPNGKIVVKLFDEVGTKKIDLGKIEIPLAPFREGEKVIDKWFPIDESPFRGDIRIKLAPHFSSQSQQDDGEQKPVPAASETNLNSGKPHQSEPEKDENPSIRKLRAMQRERLGNVEDMSVEEMELETERMKQDSLQSTIRSMQLLDQSKTIATESMNKLEHQGNQLKGVNRDLDLIDAYTDDTKRKIRSIKSIFGSAANLFSKNKAKDRVANLSAQHTFPTDKELKNRQHNEERRAIEKRNKLWGKPRSQSDPVTPIVEHGQPNGEEKKKGDEELKKNKKESEELMEKEQAQQRVEPEEKDELDHHLDAMSSAIMDLKNYAINIGTELNEQSEIIDQISVKTDSNSVKLKQQTMQIEKKL